MTILWRVDRAQLREPALSRRERQVAELVADGLLNKHIAAEIGISEKTVKEHVTSIAKRWQLDGGRNLRVQIAWRIFEERAAWRSIAQQVSA